MLEKTHDHQHGRDLGPISLVAEQGRSSDIRIKSISFASTIEHHVSIF